ncbi:uncharacterized protein LOC126563730 isoform X3 [Anopheles maculipalpis]|uniref:uncharacterized protein LOC126563730 isoform X3 n=1 Tax=Anopheles maculipalpis TaxID=1496333 RepID=UPI00215993A7|nr:uncharacterized protein LOC126563730 isoform X3 [Anopheles maculipalpis]
MEQNIFDVSDDISFPWLPAYAEATEASPLNTTSSRMLETIVEETSDDDDGRGDKDQAGTQQPLSWSQYDHVWSSGGSDAESVIRVETPSDQDTMSERDFICPPKRRKQETSFGDEFLASDLSAIYGRRPRICEPDGLEANEYFMKRHNEQRLRFDEIGHDLFTDSDSLSYASLSRSSSLIQFESLERQLQNETSVNQHPLSGSSPSLYTTEPNTATSPGGYHGGDTARGKSVATAINGGPAGSNLLTTSNLIQKSIAQTALNISDSELYSTSSSVSSTGSCSGPDSSSNASTSTSSNSSSSSGFRYTDNRVGAVEDRLVEADRGIGGGTTTPEDTGDTEEELLSATVRCHSSRCSERQRPSGRGISARNKNSIESLSEDSGYCDHLQQHGGGSMNSGGGLRARSKSLTNFGSAENITFVCGNGGGMFPSTQQHEQQQPLSLDCIAMEVRHVATNHENRLSTVCDVDEEEEEEEEEEEDEEEEDDSDEQEKNSDDGCSVDANCIVPSLTPATIDRQHAPKQAQLWTNINNGTKIEHAGSSCKQRTLGESRQQQQQGVEFTPRTVTSMASSSADSEIKNSTPVGRTRLRPLLSLSAPDLLVGAAVDRQRRHRRRQNDERTPSASSGTVGLYDPISFAVSSVPECLNLYGGAPSNRSRHGSFDSDSASSEFLRHGYGYAGACGESVASKNFNLYDLQHPQQQRPYTTAPVKCTKTVTFQTGSCTSSPSRPKQNIRASYANLTALNYSDEEEDDPVYGGRRGHEYYLSRNTFRTSSGTRLGGGGSRTSHTTVPRTTLLTVPMDHHQRGPLPEKMDVGVVVEEELADDEESSIFPVDRDEKSVYHSLLEEMSAHFDRNLSIINDQAAAYEPIAAFLHEQRSSANASGSARTHATLGTITPPQAPPRRTQIKTNPHLPQQSTGSPAVPPKLTVVNPVTTVVTPPPQSAGTARRRTFDQDPTNLVTCYAASLERCTFDPTESSTTSLGPTSDLHTNGGVALPRYVPVPVKREFVASTPNLHYYHGTIADSEGTDDSRPDHHNSLRNVSTCRSTGSILATASSSRCGLSKGVSFCPIVSEIIWKSTGSSDLEPDDNGSVISNHDFEIDIDEDDFEADDMDHVNLQLENSRLAAAGDDRHANPLPAGTRPEDERSQRNNGVPEREHTLSDRGFYSNGLQAKNKSEGELYAMIRAEDGYVQHPTTLIANDRTESLQLHSANGAGLAMTSSDLSYAGDLSSAGQASRNRMMSDTNGASVVLVADERRNGGSNSNNGAMASRSLIASEQTRLVNSSDNVQGMQGKSGSAATLPAQYTTNSSLIKNFKNGKAEKKGKTFLSRISSGFRFSFRNKSKKGAGGGMLKESSSFTAPSAVNNNNNINAKVGSRGGSSSGNDSASADFIYIPLKDPHRKQNHHRSDEPLPVSYLQRQISAAGVTVDDSFTGVEDEPDDCEIAVTRPGGYYRSDSSTALNGESGTGVAGEQLRGGTGNHVLSSKPPLPKQPPRVVGVCAKRSSTSPASLKHAHAQRASSTPPRETEQDELDSTATSATMSSSYYQRRSPSQHQYAANGSYGGSYHGGADTLSVEGYGDEDEYYYGAGGDGRLAHRGGSIMGSEQKIGLIETNLDTHETIISGKTRSLMELGGGQHYRGYHHLQQQHQQQQHQQTSSGVPHGHHQLQVHDPSGQRPSNGIKDHHHHRQPGTADGPGRPHKSMEFLLDKENQRNVLPPENELQKSHETGTNLSEHQLRVQASLQRLNIPDWYKQYSGKDGGPANTTAPTVAAGGAAAGGGILRKRNSDVGRWTGLSSKTTSLSSLGSHRSDRSPVMLSPSAHSHHGQTGFSRWSTSHLNSNQTSPSVSTRGSFTRGGLNASVISGYSTASTTAGTGANSSSSTIRNSFRQPYLGWRSQEKLSQPRTPAERLASSLLQQQGTNKQKEQQQLKEQQQKGKQQQHPQKEESVVTPEIQSSIIEVTSAIVHYVNDQTNRHSRSRSTSPSQRCWLESSFVGTRPLDSPQTPLIENSSVLGSGHHQQHPQQQQQQPQTAGDHYRFNAGRMNGVGGVANSCLTPTAPNSTSSNHTLQIEPMQARRRSEGDAAGTRKRNDSGGSMAISSTTTTTTTSGSTNQSGRSHQQQQQQQHQQPGTTTKDLLGVDSRIARRVSLDSAEATGHHHRGHDYLKCRYPRCDATATLAEARKTYKSCHNCSHLYCSRECRRAHWERHRKACLHSRVSALCRLVLSTCKDDADTLRHLSALARRGYLSQGRGVVRILFRSPEGADSFIKQGFQCLGEVSYVRWPDLLPAEMGPELYSELLKLSTEYKPDSKMLIYVAICVVSEAPGSATAPVKWERQLVSRCAKLKLCRSVVNEIVASGSGAEKTSPRADTVGDVLVLSFNILSKTTQRSREQVSLNIQTILRQRGVNLRKHYPEVFQRLATFVEGSTDRFLPVTLHPRDNVTGRSFVCIIMPNYGDSERVQFPVSENSDDRVVTVDVGADLGDDLTSKL